MSGPTASFGVDRKRHVLIGSHPSLYRKVYANPLTKRVTLPLANYSRAPDNQPRRIISSCIHLVNRITFQRRAATHNHSPPKQAQIH
jgi:hypothetical protein